ncbi:double-stranded RNA-binding protein 8-like isoform X5 [Fagus crenata]
MPTNEGFQGVSNCYVFKSRLQEYAQKIGLSTPVYETIKEGPSHEPCFRSTVIVNDVRYDSLPGFFNRKAAEQSAAEVALLELAKAGEVNHSISQPVHETGLCKNLLQEYAQKMNYAIPLYQCQKVEAPGRVPLFWCTVEIGGILYIGAATKTKKEAEIKAARTALLAIQSNPFQLSDKSVHNSQLTVIPCKKRGPEVVTTTEEAANVPNAKKARCKKKTLKKNLLGDRAGNSQVENGSKLDQTNAHGVQEAGLGPLAVEAIRNSQNGRSDVRASEKAIPAGKCPLAMEAKRNPQNGQLDVSVNEKEISAGDGSLAHQVDGNCNNGQLTALNSQSNVQNPNVGTYSISSGDMTALTKEVNGVAGVASTADNSTMVQIETSSLQLA